MRAHFILYVHDQPRATTFYQDVLGRQPRLDVPGMTEFEIDGAVLGLMPEAGIRSLLPALPNPEGVSRPRAELYLLVPDANAAHRRALAHGALELSAVQAREWGHRAGYCLDPDEHVLAFAELLPADPG